MPLAKPNSLDGLATYQAQCSRFVGEARRFLGAPGGPAVLEAGGVDACIDAGAEDARGGGAGVTPAELRAQLQRPSLRLLDADDAAASQAVADVLAHPQDCADFESFAAGRAAAKDVSFCLAAEAYRIKYTTRALSRETQLREAAAIYHEFVADSAPHRVALSPEAVFEVEEGLEAPESEVGSDSEADPTDVLAHVFSTGLDDVVGALAAAHLRDFAAQQKKRRGLARAAQILADAARIGASVDVDASPVSSRRLAARAHDAPGQHPGLNVRKLYAHALRSDARARGIEAARRLAAAVSMTSAQGHDMWRQEWQLDPRNRSGADARLKHGENIDVHFSALNNTLNQAENLRAAELAVTLALRPDLPRQTQLEIVHDTWRRAAANVDAAGTPVDVPYFRLPPSEKRKQAMWLSAARQAVTEVSNLPESDDDLDEEAENAAASDEEEDDVPRAKKQSPEKRAIDVAVLVVAAAGHRQWREAWHRDMRNENGSAPRVKYGENIDVPFEQLRQPANSRDNLRAAERAIVLVLREDISEDTRLHLLHEDWLASNPHARLGPLDRPFGELSPACQAKDALWLSSARTTLCLDYVAPRSATHATVTPRSDGAECA